MITARMLPSEYPFLLQQISPLPDHLDLAGILPPDNYKFLCVIGARRYSSYGKEACAKLISGLRGYPIAVVSGMAIGIDSLAHEAALEAGLRTIAFPGSGLSESVLYPASRIDLARRIVGSGNALLSPFRQDQEGSRWTFPERNRLMAGISHATLIIEARKGSGTLLTAEHAVRFNRDVLAVPGSIFSDLSYGPHMLIRSGATPATSSSDVLEALGFDLKARSAEKEPLAETPSVILSPEEKELLKHIASPISRDELIRELKMPPAYVNSILVNLELQGIIAECDGAIGIA